MVQVRVWGFSMAKGLPPDLVDRLVREGRGDEVYWHVWNSAPAKTLAKALAHQKYPAMHYKAPVERYQSLTGRFEGFEIAGRRR